MHDVTIIENSRRNKFKLDAKRVWQYRALIRLFTIRDIKLQFTQTRFGMVWSFVQAITAAIIVNFFFGTFINFEIIGIPYLVFAFPGMMAWYFFSYILNSAGTSLIASQHIIKKVYFPKLILPLYKTLVGLFDFAVWFIVYLAILLYYQYPVTWKILLLPVPLILNMITGLSIAIWLSALTIRFRDAFLIVPFLAAFGIFITPVFYPGLMLPTKYYALVFANPMAGVIDLYRVILVGTPLDARYVVGFIPVAILFVSGLFYFRRVENTIADLV